MIADLLSLSRILLGILFILVVSNKYLALSIVVLAGLTDMLDGFFARKYGKTKLGVILDPVADRIFVLLVVIGLIFNYGLNVLYGVLMLSRDIVNSVILPALHLLKGKRKVIEANKLSKLTTVMLFLTFVAIILNFYSLEFIFAAIGISVFTAIHSLVFNFP